MNDIVITVIVVAAVIFLVLMLIGFVMFAMSLVGNVIRAAIPKPKAPAVPVSASEAANVQALMAENTRQREQLQAIQAELSALHSAPGRVQDTQSTD